MQHDTSHLDLSLLDELLDDEGLAAEYEGQFDDPEDDELDIDEIPTETATFETISPELPAAERIADLLEKMAPRRKVLLSIIAGCETRAAAEDVEALVADLEANNQSVYTAANYCVLLERAGALVRTDAEGGPWEESVPEPVTEVDEDGNEYLTVPEQAPTFWEATEEGLAAVAEDHPEERLAAVLADYADYRTIYERLLALCDQEGGAAMKALGDAVDNDPLLRNPRRYAAFFLEHLEKNDAVVWDGTWKTTDLGHEVLASLQTASSESEE